MSLKLLKEEKLNKTIINSYTYPLEIEKEGIYLVEITASAKSRLQNLLSGFQADKLKLQIAGKIFDQEASIWNGYLLQELSKTIVFILPLRIGCYYLRFIAENKPFLEKIKIYQVTDNKIFFKPTINNPPQDGNRRPWYSFIFYNISLKKFSLTASADKKTIGFFKDDDDDLQLVFNGSRIKNKQTNWHKYWYWCGRILNGAEQTYIKQSDFRSDSNIIELNADRQPHLREINLELDKIRGYLPIIRPYKSLNGEDYNKYDQEIYQAVKHWNDEFAKQKLPPPEPLDPNLVKAIAYKESRLGNNKKADIDIMQVANEDDPALHTLNNDKWIFPSTGKVAREREWQDGKVEIVDYHGQAKVEKIYDSFYWGVRWLYHKAQGITHQDERFWRGWEEAVKRYGPPEDVEPEYANKIWDLYIKGVDPHRKKKTYLWISLAAILFTGTIFWNMMIYTNWDDVSENSQSTEEGQVKGEYTESFEGMSQKEFIDYLKESMEKAIDKYPVKMSENRKLFEPISKLLLREGLDYQWIFDQYTEKLVEKSENLNQFIEAGLTLQIIRDRVWEVADFDNDGENELVFLQDDALNKDYIYLFLVDKHYSNKYQLINYKMTDSYFNSISSSIMPDKPLSLLDVTNDPTPEILVFSNSGRYGACLTVFQYDNSAAALEQIFRYTNIYYPEYVFTDQNYNNQLEIIVKNRSRGTEMYVVPLQETFEYNSSRGRFELVETIE